MTTRFKKQSPGKLYTETLILLKNRPRILTLADIEEATGIAVGWLQMFSAGKIPDPSVNRIEVLNAFLKS